MHHASFLDSVEFDLFDSDSVDEEIEVRLTGLGHEVTWGRCLSGDFARETEESRSIDDDDCPRSPPPPPRPDPHELGADPHLGRVVVTPDIKPKAVTNTIDIDTVELQLEYLRTLKKMTRLMQRSDATRAIVKKQRTSDDEHGNFFASTRWGELEQTRHKVARLIHHESATRIIF